MSEYNFDLAIIGAGPGGYVAGIRGAQLGFKVAVIEQAELGGVCLNWGCIPTKALIRSAEVYHYFTQAAKYGLTADRFGFDFPKVVQRSRQIAERASKGIAYLFKKNQVTHIQGKARLLAANQIEITAAQSASNQTIRAKNVIIATGARPRALPGVPFDQHRILSSKEVMVLPQVPKSMIIIGAGAIGVEFAYIYRTFGSEITLLEMLPQLLPQEDAEGITALARSFRRQKIEVLTQTRVEAVVSTGDAVQITAQTLTGQRQLTAEVVLVAIGVQANIENLGLETLGLEMSRGFIKVNADYHTNVPGIYAIGDVIGPPLLAHVASAEGKHAVEHLAGKAPTPLNYNQVPFCTYCQPQVASIGLTEQQAREQGYSVQVGRYPFIGHGKALAIGENEGQIKLIFDAASQRLLGAQMVGPEVTELLAEISLALSCQATVQQFVKTIHAHPTLSEGVMEAAAAALGEAIHI
ncbi:dihydrolipoyl dehydrogenase [candidate division KSB1 bacterium]|nr:dihydrolipoyl dehydrogenase [candidate division KSB1 bacterium]